MYSFLADMRQRGLEPWLDGDGMINLSYEPDKAYFDYLKANKSLALLEFAVEVRTGIRLDLLAVGVKHFVKTDRSLT